MPDPASEPEPPPPVGTPSCTMPPLTVDTFDNPYGFTDNRVVCAFGSGGTLVIATCGDSSDSVGFIGDVASETRASINRVWADSNGNGRADAEEIETSSSSYPISGNLNLENNGATLSITDLRIGTDFWPLWFRGDCFDSGDSAIGLEEDSEQLKWTTEELLDTLE